jgi:hypothetical protein
MTSTTIYVLLLPISIQLYTLVSSAWLSPWSYRKQSVTADNILVCEIVFRCTEIICFDGIVAFRCTKLIRFEEKLVAKILLMPYILSAVRLYLLLLHKDSSGV